MKSHNPMYVILATFSASPFTKKHISLGFVSSFHQQIKSHFAELNNTVCFTDKGRTRFSNLPKTNLPVMRAGFYSTLVTTD